MSKNGIRNENGLVNRLMSKCFVFGALVILFVAMVSGGVVAVASADEDSELLVSIKGKCHSLSPDWKKVAFIGSDYYIYVIDSDGSNLRKLTETINCMLYSWSPKGEKILYFVYEPMNERGIWIMNSDGSSKKQLLKTVGEAFPSFFLWSPDGGKIILEDLQLENKIFVMNSDGSDKKLITAGIPLSWTPDGKKIIFSEKESRQFNYSIWEIDLDSGISKKLTNIPTCLWGVDISHDASKIAYADNGIWVVNIDGSNLKQLTQSEADCYPIWSHDSKRISFISEKGIKRGIWMMNFDGSGQKKVVELSPEDIERRGLIIPVWKQDGSKIAYAIYDQKNETIDIYTINVGKPSPVKQPSGETPSVSIPKPPGFEAIFAIGGILVIAYLLRRKK